ncbi:MalY/PatB family protein [Streptomyces flaveolus]|uniref:MalY/PatB family protein n=1 Tax=Streptomyces flaveolus TaxID=67297 RepID=UPI0033F269F3
MAGTELSSVAFDGVSAERMRRDGHLKWTMLGAGLLGADAAEMDFGTAPAIAEALHSAVDRGILGYVPPAFEVDLSEACATWQRDRYGWHVSPEDVRVVPDVIRALHLAIEYFSRPGSPVIVPVPAYMPFLEVPGLLGRQTIEIELTLSEGRYVYDLDALRDAYRAGGHLLLLCNPHNPLGRVMKADELMAISEVVDEYGGRVFADEIHAPIVYPGHRHIPYASLSSTAAGQAITAVSASKAWNLAGLKCAQVLLSNAADRDRWAQLGRLATDGTSILGVIAGSAAFRNGGDWLRDVLKYLDGNRQLLDTLLREGLPGVSYRPPEGTYLGWLDCRCLDLPGANIGEFFLHQARVALVDGAACGESGHGFVRMNFATSRSILERIVTQMVGSVASMPGAGG